MNLSELKIGQKAKVLKLNILSKEIRIFIRCSFGLSFSDLINENIMLRVLCICIDSGTLNMVAEMI